MSNNPAVRGFRNFGIIGCYLSLAIGLFALGWRRMVPAWCLVGLVSGAAYFIYEAVSYHREKDPEARPSLATFLHGLIVWPIMLPEVIENSLAELGVLKAGQQAPTSAPSEVEERPDDPDGPKPEGD